MNTLSYEVRLSGVLSIPFFDFNIYGSCFMSQMRSVVLYFAFPRCSSFYSHILPIPILVLFLSNYRRFTLNSINVQSWKRGVSYKSPLSTFVENPQWRLVVPETKGQKAEVLALLESSREDTAVNITIAWSAGKRLAR